MAEGRKEGGKKGKRDGRKKEGKVIGINERMRRRRRFSTLPLPSVSAINGSGSAVIVRLLEGRDERI